MKKTVYSAMMSLFVAAVMISCNKDKEQSDVALTVSETTDSTAVIKCDYSPAKSASYKLQIGEAISEEYTESMGFTVAGLNGGTKYDLVATTYNGGHKKVGTTVVKFRTTGTPDNEVHREIIIPIIF